MAKTIPMIITNSDILVKDRDTDDFKTFSLPGTPVVANIPFYHHYAAKISETQHYFKEFIKSMYGKKLSKNILAILVPDDTTALESIFINELFLNSDACKAVAQMKMGQALSKTDESYVSISKSGRNLVLLYVKNNEVIVRQTKIVTKTRCDNVCFPWGAKTTGYSSDAVDAVSSPSAPSPAEGSARR